MMGVGSAQLAGRQTAATAYFGLCVRVHGLVGCHVELWVKHVLDQTAKLDEAVGLQVVQRDVV